jgi:hypothetical protein
MICEEQDGTVRDEKKTTDGEAPSTRDPGGLKNDSRWLSEERATPPDRAFAKNPHPDGMRVSWAWDPVVSLRSTTGYRLGCLPASEGDEIDGASGFVAVEAALARW